MMSKSPLRWGASKIAGRVGFGAVAFATLAGHVHATPIDATGFETFLSDFVCDVTEEDYNGAHYLEITLRNCGLVGRYQDEITDAINDSLHEIVDESDTQREDWLNRTTAAAAACEQAQFLLEANDFVSAANISVNAWGSIIMRGKECCVLTRPPYCIDKDWSGATAAIAIPFLILVLLLISGLLASFRKKPHKEPAELGAGSHDKQLPSAPDGQKRRQLEKQLHNEWTNQSPLRVLPHSRDFANSAASLFAALWESYNFQEASVLNQFEHLISLLRSQVAMVADRAIGEGVQVQEGELLPEALGDLHAELLNGFCRWRKRFRDHPMTNMEVDDSEGIAMPKLCGAKWEPISRAAGGANAGEMSRQLAEISAFLLVWGEAGNIRFMPEVVYFLTELVLESDKAGEPHSLKALYQLEDKEINIVNLKSGLFLSRVIRPIYDMLFEEWYDKVDVNKDNKKDVKKLKNGLEAYIPPHVANYDDWNEFVANPDKMVEGFFQTDGTPLFQHPHGQRFKQLAKVDWGLSLEARETKTHRELHSLWGVFAAIHRVILVHMVLFFGGVITVYNGKEIPDSPDGKWVLLGQATLVRYAALGLVVPIHALAWGIAQYQVTGPALRPNCYRCECFTRRFQYLRDLCASFCQPVCGCPESGGRTVRCLLWKPWLIFFIIPAITYGMIRVQDGQKGDYDGDDVSFNLLIVHFAVSGYLCAHLLLVPNYRYTIFPFENLTHVPILLRIIRYIFWGSILAIKFFLGMVVAQAVSDAVESLEISRPGMQSWKEITKVYFTSHWGATVLQWLIFWVTNFYLFFTDTALWYIAGCGILGMVTTVVQRHFAKNQDTCALVSFMSEDAVAKIPQRFSKKVLCYAPPGKDQLVSQKFPPIWDRICEYMRYEDKINSITMGNLSYDVEASGHQVYWEDLAQPVGQRRATGTGSGTGTGTGTGPSELLSSTTGAGERKRVRVPNIFKRNTPVEGCLKSYGCVPDQDWPSNTDIQWRITALARGLGLPMPRPYRCPYMPGLTVLIPHYGEAILMQKKELFMEGRNDIVPLIDWLTHKYGQEFDDFTTRMQARAARGEPWPVVGTEWDRYTESQWTKVSNWAAMRQQTLFRTVAGMCYYHPAIQSHFELQGDKNCSLGKVWDASDCFTCIVSMQMFVFFDGIMSDHTNYMFEKFPRCLKVAYIDYDEKGQHWEKDNVHKNQKRRYYSCLIDRSCERDGMKRKPRFRIELPGYPILGDGKGDNQNHAIPFMRGHYSQCIDANQGAYFEQMMLLPNALAEFRSKKRGDNGGKKIIGFPEHITSDIGSIGDFAASAEVAFGTILQRTYSVLGARMHYGHPDIMNKLFMIQQGGVSKATKTINLSEDIFAGMDFTLRGDGRTIKHCEYFNLAKGRDLGFNTVLGFFSKLSSGTGEQVLTRQVFRLGQVMHLPEALSFYYAHAGYYLTQFFVSWALPLLVFMWLLVLVSDCDDNFASVQQCDPELDANTADVMAGLLATCYSWIMLLFIFATMFPLFAELWMQRSFGFAVFKVIQSYMTMAPLLFVFQAKCIGHYVVNEFRYGGATYVATGRGLPTERRPFIGEPEARKRTVKCEPGDLRFDVDPSSGKVWTVEDGGQAKKLGVMPGHMVTKIDDMPFSKASLNRMMHGKQAYTIEIKASYLMLKKVGGLYLDYAVISYYDGAMLLFAVILVFLAGGLPSENALSLIWMFISLALTIIAWLYGPFIFNPYQYEASHFRNDLRALLSFFLQDSGRHWVDWYDRTQLKAGHGLATTLVDITFFMFIFAVAAWYVAVNAKVQAFESVFSQYNLANMLYVAVLVPPVIASFAFTCVVVLLELCGGCSSTIQRNLENRVAQLREQVRRATAGKEDEELEDPDAGAAVGGKAEDVEVGAPKTGRKTTMALGESATRRLGCSVGIPLPLSAITVVILDCVEACFFLIEFYRVGWYKGLMAGLILKLFLLSGVISLAEGVLVSRTFDKLIKCYEPLGLPLATWVRAHRMLRDILTSLLIFLPQSLLVLLNSMNECLCPTCNCHQLCLYRDPGHIKRSEQELSSLIEEQAEPLATATPPTQTGMPTSTTSGTNPGASAVQRSRGPRSPQAEHSMDFKDDKGDTILLTVNKEGGVDFYCKDVKTLKELTVVAASGRSLHMEGQPCGRWPGSWDVTTKVGEEENAQRAVALFNGEPYQPRSAPWWDFSSWFAPSEAKATI